MMEKLGAPQTHLGLKSMIKEVDEDFDGKLSFREVPVSYPVLGPWRGSVPEGTLKCTVSWSTNGVGLSRAEFGYLIYSSACKNNLRH